MQFQYLLIVEIPDINYFCRAQSGAARVARPYPGGHSTDDPTAQWPKDRRRVKLREFNVTRPTTVEAIGGAVMMRGPARVTAGIEVSDDPFLAARCGVYELSVAYRTRGWKAMLECAGCLLAENFVGRDQARRK